MTAGKCYLGVANALCIDGMDYIIVANTKDNLAHLAQRVSAEIDPHHYFPVAVVHEAAVTLEDDEL